MTIQPNSDFQKSVLSCSADIMIFGGGAGGGKSFGLLMDGVRGTTLPDYNAIILRRTNSQIRKPGALLDTSKTIYPHLRAKLNDQQLTWNFPTGSKITFSHCQYDKDVEDHQGAQYAFIGFDELTYFSAYQFWFLVGRNRSTCGIKPYIRATCNPDAESWVKELIEWWLDKDGYAIESRCGVLRYFIRLGDAMVWGDSVQEVIEIAEKDTSFLDVVSKAEEKGLNRKSLVKSFTYIHGNVYENKDLLLKNPAYLGNLMSYPEAEKKRFLYGSWQVSEDGMNLCEYEAVTHIFDNYPIASNFRCITCDAARYGRDLMVIIVWQGWEVLMVLIRKLSDAHDIVKDIEDMRVRWGVSKGNVIVDNDGVGGDTVKLGQYVAFRAMDKPFISRDVKKKENYDCLKSQCAYHSAEQINLGIVRFNVTSANVLIWTGTKFENTVTIKLGSKLWRIEDLIKADLRAWKRVPRKDDKEPIRLNTKDEQKIMLGGRSPDCGDNFILRACMDLRPKAPGVTHHK